MGAVERIGAEARDPEGMNKCGDQCVSAEARGPEVMGKFGQCRGGRYLQASFVEPRQHGIVKVYRHFHHRNCLINKGVRGQEKRVRSPLAAGVLTQISVSVRVALQPLQPGEAFIKFQPSVHTFTIRSFPWTLSAWSSPCASTATMQKPPFVHS